MKHRRGNNGYGWDSLTEVGKFQDTINQNDIYPGIEEIVKGNSLGFPAARRLIRRASANFRQHTTEADVNIANVGIFLVAP